MIFMNLLNIFTRVTTDFGELINRNKFKSWAACYAFWLMDLLTTLFILSNFGDKIAEANPISAWFFGNQLFGIFCWAVIVAGVTWFLLFILPIIFGYFSYGTWKLINLFRKRDSWFIKDKKKYLTDYANHLRGMFLPLYIMMFIRVIIHNAILFVKVVVLGGQ